MVKVAIFQAEECQLTLLALFKTFEGLTLKYANLFHACLFSYLDWV